MLLTRNFGAHSKSVFYIGQIMEHEMTPCRYQQSRSGDVIGSIVDATFWLDGGVGCGAYKSLRTNHVDRQVAQQILYSSSNKTICAQKERTKR